MGLLRISREAGTLVGCKRNIWSCTLFKVVEFTNDPSIVEVPIKDWSILMRGVQQLARGCWG